ncbi:MAG TPA: twin-arginine translocase TatA/TatE family subunit [Gammaproteobacteria bacterium]
MGLSGISIWQLLIILLIVVLVFGTKRLKTLGSDLGGALKSFRKAMEQDDDKDRAGDDPKRLEAGGVKQATEPDAEFVERKDKASQS